MKIESIATPQLNSIPNAQAVPQISARDKAVQAFMRATTPAQAGAQEHPVSNPSQVSPEEVSAIAPSQSSTNEAPAEAPAAPQEPLSSQYAILARKEKALRQREQQLRAREAALKPAAAPEAKPAIDESLYVRRDRLTEDPFTVLNELGLNYDRLTELALNAPKPEQLAMQAELKALREEMKALKGETEKTLEQSQQQQNQQALNLMRQEAKKLVATDPNLEMIKITPGATNEIVKLIEDTYYKDGEFLSVEEAAQMVEDYLADEAMKYARAKKIQQRLQPAPAAQKPNGTPQQPQLKTLTNSVSGSRPLSARERALLAFEGKLQK